MFARARLATLAFVALVAAAMTFAIVSSRSASGTPAVALVPATAESNATFRVTHASDGSGLRAGDIISVAGPQSIVRLQFAALRVGSRFVVRRIAPPPPELVAIPVRAVGSSAITMIFRAIFGLLLGMAALLALRARSREALSLAMLFTSIVALVNPVNADWPDWAAIAYATSEGSLLTLASVFAIDFATRLRTRADDRQDRRVRRWAVVVALPAIALEIAIGAWGLVRPTMPMWLQAIAFCTLASLPLGFVATLGWVYATSTVAERARVAWVVASLGLGVGGLIAAIVLTALGVTEPARDYPIVTLALVPVGCGYAIVRYRVVDVGFVLNRAAVFGVTSLVVLGALALVDLGLQHVVGSWLVANGAAIQIAVALAIGIASRPLHARVDAFVDDVFFRERHAALGRLHAVARDVAFIDDANVALERVVTTVARTSQARCSVLLEDASGYCLAVGSDGERRNRVDRNDETVVRLLATRAPVELAAVETALGGDVAFPMFARNRLLGVLVCGERAVDEAYAPDTIVAIAAVATALAVALDLLRIEALERELVALRAASRVPLA